MDILTFLNSVYDQVIELFGDLYHRVKDAALNALNWAIQQAQQALNAANYFTLQIQEAIYTTVWRWVQDAIALFETVSDDVGLFVGGVTNDILTWVEEQLQGLLDWVEATFGPVWDWVLEQVNIVLATVTGWIDEVRNFALGLINDVMAWVTDQYNALYNLVTTIWSMVTGSNPAGTPLLLTFLADPLGFIAAHLWAIFIEVFCYAIGHGLGTVIYTLPDKPEWSGGGLEGGTGGNMPNDLPKAP